MKCTHFSLPLTQCAHSPACLAHSVYTLPAFTQCANTLDFHTVCPHSRLSHTVHTTPACLTHSVHTLDLCTVRAHTPGLLTVRPHSRLSHTVCTHLLASHTVCIHSRLAHSAHTLPLACGSPCTRCAHSRQRTHSQLSPGPALRRASLAGRVNDSRGSAAHFAYCVRGVDAQQLGTFYDFTGLWGGECQPSPPLG